MNIRQSAEVREFDRLYKEIDNLYHAVAVQAGVADSAFLTIYTIVELGDGCLQKDIALRYSLSPQTISSAVRSLEKQGYIALRPGKGRNMHLHLTAKGREFATERIAPLVAAENSVFGIMPIDESRELLRLSRKYNEIFKNQITKLLQEQGE